MHQVLVLHVGLARKIRITASVSISIGRPNPEHPLAKKGILTDDDLVNATWILREEGSGTRQIFDRAFHDLLPKLNVLMELQHTEAIKRAADAYNRTRLTPRVKSLFTKWLAWTR